MRLFNQFLWRNVAQRAVQRLVYACERVKQDIVRDHEGVLRSLRLLLTCPTVKIQRSGKGLPSPLFVNESRASLDMLFNPLEQQLADLIAVAVPHHDGVVAPDPRLRGERALGKLGQREI